MTFLFREHEDWLEWEAAFEAYMSYLRENKARIPRSAYEFATAQWHWDSQDFRCPHASWVEELAIREPEAEETRHDRKLEIHLRLLGTYHNGYLEIHYVDVHSYALNSSAARSHPRHAGQGHGDWMVDEVRLSHEGLVTHEIEFAGGARWLIECADIKYEWKPFETPAGASKETSTPVDDCGIGSRPGGRRLQEDEQEVLELIEATAEHREDLIALLNKISARHSSMSPAQFLGFVGYTLRTMNRHGYVDFARGGGPSRLRPA